MNNKKTLFVLGDGDACGQVPLAVFEEKKFVIWRVAGVCRSAGIDVVETKLKANAQKEAEI